VSERTAPPGPSGSGEPLPAGTIRAKFRVSRKVLAPVRAEVRDEPERRRRGRADRLARQLALAHWIDRAIEAGHARNYADVARALGLTQVRITQIAGLLRLSPAMQERVLLDEVDLGGRVAMRASSSVEWEQQESWLAIHRRVEHASSLRAVRGLLKQE